MKKIKQGRLIILLNFEGMWEEEWERGIIPLSDHRY